jgi:hypothetical protein
VSKGSEGESEEAECPDELGFHNGTDLMLF